VQEEEGQEGGGSQEVQEEERTLIMARRGTLTLFASLAMAVALLPAAAGAETRTFVNNTDLFADDGGQNIVGPANEYPSSIVVSGVPGTVTKATVTMLDLDSANADDIDMAITGPNGRTVMLMSDACGDGVSEHDWTFDDAALTFIPDLDCPGSQDASFKPSNYVPPPGTEVDDLSAPPLGAPNAPAPPYLNKLSFLAGGSPNGSWNLFVRDDDPGVIGFTINAWVLTLDVKPPAAAPVTPPPATVTSTPPPAGQAPATKKCKRKKGKKPSAAAAKKCKKKRKK
jgi:hypothetical protein